jgi:hypothetical protein
MRVSRNGGERVDDDRVGRGKKKDEGGWRWMKKMRASGSGRVGSG